MSFGASVETTFNRTKDWAHLEKIKTAGTSVTQTVIAMSIALPGADDERVDQHKSLTGL